MSVNLRRMVAVLAGLAGVLAFDPAFAARIGVAAAVRNDVQDVTGGSKMAPGSQLFEQQVVKTGDASAAQLLFLDETSLSLGPKAQIKLDKFVYNPNKKTGDVVLSATKGAFRFVSGGQDPRSYKIQTPVATIGVRGTIVDFTMINGNLVVIVQEGKAIVDGKVVKGGHMLVITADHHVIGPMEPDGKFFAVAGIFPFPLYGQDLGEVIERIDTGRNSKTDILDVLASRHELPEPPPPPPDCDWGSWGNHWGNWGNHEGNWGNHWGNWGNHWGNNWNNSPG